MNTGSAALAVALAEKHRASRNWKGWCLVFTRTCLGVPARYASAIIAWTRVTPNNRHGGAHPPPGVPVFWDVGVHGHVALSAGGGYCWSTDILRTGKVDKVRIDYITKRWNARYLGWTETLNGVRVYSAAHQVPRNTRVRLAALVEAAAADVAGAQGTRTHPKQVTVLEKALVAEGLLDDRHLDGSYGTRTVRAYRRWQRRCGVARPTGVPTDVDLTKLASKYGFRIRV